MQLEDMTSAQSIHTVGIQHVACLTLLAKENFYLTTQHIRIRGPVVPNQMPATSVLCTQRLPPGVNALNFSLYIEFGRYFKDGKMANSCGTPHTCLQIMRASKENTEDIPGLHSSEIFIYPVTAPRTYLLLETCSVRSMYQGWTSFCGVCEGPTLVDSQPATFVISHHLFT